MGAEYLRTCIRKWGWVLCLLPWISSAYAQQTERISVGLFWDNRPTGMIVTVNQGRYALYGDDRKIADLTTRDVLKLSNEQGKIRVKSFGASAGLYGKLSFREATSSGSLNLKPTNGQPNRTYEDNFTITVWRGRLKVVNQVDFANYLAGVVQSESGNYHEPEYYKVQAIISRTYALKHFHRYKEFGFNLCDRVDSQVYKTYGYNDTIRQAVAATKDVVIVDADINLITAVFHSNSGGYTVNSEDVWSSPLPYLRAVSDTFSICEPHYDWTLGFSRSTYLNYFQRNFGMNIQDTAVQRQLLNYCPSERATYMFESGVRIPLKQVRKDFALKSTQFCVGASADSVWVVGRGFGHGVGLSQEGAMRMARLGYPYTDILHHYYRGIHLIQLSVIDFFRE